MGVFQETVPKWMYDALQSRYDDLLAKYHSLRPTHSPVAPMRVTAPREEPGMATLHAIEATINDPRIARMADTLMQQKPGLSREQAITEATRLHAIGTGKATAPPASGVPGPPVR